MRTKRPPADGATIPDNVAGITDPGNAWQNLLTCAGSQRFERHDIAEQMNARGRYDVILDTEFPLLIKLFHFTSDHHTRGVTWHERLELFLPLDGPARFRMGTENLRLKAGDVLVVDNLKLHHVVDFLGFDTRVIVISFLPNFVYSLGSPSHDFVQSFALGRPRLWADLVPLIEGKGPSPHPALRPDRRALP